MNNRPSLWHLVWVVPLGMAWMLFCLWLWVEFIRWAA